MFLKFIHVDFCINSSLRFIVIQHFIVRDILKFTIHFTIEEHVDYSQFLVIEHNASVNILVYVFCFYLCMYFSELYT